MLLLLTKNFQLRQNISSWKNTVAGFFCFGLVFLWFFGFCFFTEMHLFQCCFNEILVGLGGKFSNVSSSLSATISFLIRMGTEDEVLGSNFQKLL